MFTSGEESALTALTLEILSKTNHGGKKMITK